MVNKLIKSLKVKCLHVAAGCEWQGDVIDTQPHLEPKCLYEEISCSYSQSGCDMKIPRHTLEAHLQQCKFRQAVCDYCGESYLHSYLPVHFQECENFPVLCSHGCNMTVARKSTDDHLQTCSELSVECPFKDAGCLQKMLRKGLHDHEVSSVTSHLLSTKRKLESELQTTKAELAVAKMKHDQVEEKLTRAEEELRRTVIKLDAACESLNELSLRSQADVGFEVMVWENYKAVISSYKEEFLRKLSDNLFVILSKLLKSSEAVNDAFADLVVNNLRDFAKGFIASLPSVQEYSHQIEDTLSHYFLTKVWVPRLKQQFFDKAALEFSFFKSALLHECEKYRSNRANAILTICLDNGVASKYGNHRCVKLDGKVGEPRLIDYELTIFQQAVICATSLEVLSLLDDTETVEGGHWTEIPISEILFDQYFGDMASNMNRENYRYLTFNLGGDNVFAKNGYALLREYEIPKRKKKWLDHCTVITSEFQEFQVMNGGDYSSVDLLSFTDDNLGFHCN